MSSFDEIVITIEDMVAYEPITRTPRSFIPERIAMFILDKGMDPDIVIESLLMCGSIESDDANEIREWLDEYQRGYNAGRQFSNI